MPTHDSKKVAAILDVVTLLNPHDDDVDLPWVDLLRRAQGCVIAVLGDPSRALDAGQEAAVRYAVGQLHARPNDGSVSVPESVRRLQIELEYELSRWTSASTQPPGASGQSAVAEPQDLTAPEPPPEEP